MDGGLRVAKTLEEGGAPLIITVSGRESGEASRHETRVDVQRQRSRREEPQSPEGDPSQPPWVPANPSDDANPVMHTMRWRYREE